VKILMMLLARNEADIVDAQVAFHLNADVDFIVAIDNDSHDEPTQILQSYARHGYAALEQRHSSRILNAVSERRCRVAS
jgi:Glycosyl transferase family 2